MEAPEALEWVTVAQASKALGVDPRQIRRWLDRLEPKDKGQDTQRTHKGQPIVLVRLSAVEALQKGDLPQHEPKDTTKGQDKGQRDRPVRLSDAKDRTQGARDTAASEEESKLIEQLRSEVASLRDALATSQRLTDQAQQLQLMTERRAAALEAENEKLKALPPMATTTPQETAGGDSGASDPSVGVVRPWWQIWKRRSE